MKEEIVEKMQKQIKGNVKIARSKLFQRQESRILPIDGAVLENCPLPICLGRLIG